MCFFPGDPLPMTSAGLVPGLCAPLSASRAPLTLLLIDSARSGISLPIHSVASSTPASPSISPSLAGKWTISPNVMVAGCTADAEEAGVKVDVELPAVDGDAEAEADNDGDDAVVLVPGLKRGVPGLDIEIRWNLISSAPFSLQIHPPPPLPPITSSLSELNPPPLATANTPGLGGNGNPPTSTPMRIRASLSSMHSATATANRTMQMVSTHEHGHSKTISTRAPPSARSILTTVHFPSALIEDAAAADSKWRTVTTRTP